MLYKHHRFKLAIHRNRERKPAISWKLNNSILTEKGVKMKIKEEIKKTFKNTMKIKIQHAQLFETQYISKRQVYSANAYINKLERFDNSNLMAYMKALEQKKIFSIHMSIWQEIIKQGRDKTMETRNNIMKEIELVLGENKIGILLVKLAKRQREKI